VILTVFILSVSQLAKGSWQLTKKVKSKKSKVKSKKFDSMDEVCSWQ